MASSNKSVLLLLAPGAEEMEAVICIDVLRRAQIEVTVAGVLGSEPVTCSRGVKLLPDVALSAVSRTYDAVVLPGGGPGARQLAAEPAVGVILRQHWEQNALVAAICAAPLALLAHGIALGSAISHYPGLEAELSQGFELSGKRVTLAGRLITAQGPGSGFEFALTLVEQLLGAEAAQQTREPLLLG